MRHIWRPLLALLLLAGVGALAVSALELDYRLDAFLPAPKTAQQQIVVDQVSGGSAARLILAAVDGEDPLALAETSRALAERWRDIEGVERVDNGDWSRQEALLDQLMQARFVLADDIPERVAADAVAEALDDRLSDLTVAGRRVEPLIARDPLGVVEELAAGLAEGRQANRIDGAWFDAAGERALLVVQSSHAPYAIDQQQRLLEALRSSFADIAPDGQGLELAGAPVIGVASATASRSDALRLSLWGSALLLAVLAFAWRSVSAIIAGAVPLAFGVVCGLAVTVLAFGQVHGLTLAFGFTLLGVALDYPVHLFGHADRRALSATARNIRAPLLLGVTSTLIAYVAIWLSDSPGLAQLGAFSAAGLAGAALATLFLPVLDPALPRRVQPTRVTPFNWPAVPLILALAALGFLVWQGDARWSNDLSRMSPIDRSQIAADRELRAAVGGGEVRHLIATRGETLDAALEANEQTARLLASARAQGLIEGWQAASDLLPSEATQRQRLAAWPAAEEMRSRLDAAGSGFRPGAFEPFLVDLTRARSRGPISREFWQGTPLAARLDSQLTQTSTGWHALIQPVGLSDADALARFLENNQAPAQLVDLTEGSQAMVAAWRQEASLSLGLAAALIVLLLWLRLRRPIETLAVLLPPAAAVLVAAATMSYLDSGLTIVHLIGLLLTAGIGLDFALFSRSFRTDPPAAARSRRAINTCALSTGGVFLVLGQSTIGMLQMLGLTVALGILLSWLFSRIGLPR
ncbi:MMPL family transporter [Wenzhouxiangella sp. EGI_FJ10305]|uniref:MMPL family transporter n=1 Tax=Wenzhouxiangella sp. EGI_FJ10305 TaxID=3243768 RepID=UPI0035D76478